MRRQSSGAKLTRVEMGRTQGRETRPHHPDATHLLLTANITCQIPNGDGSDMMGEFKSPPV